MQSTNWQVLSEKEAMKEEFRSRYIQGYNRMNSYLSMLNVIIIIIIIIITFCFVVVVVVVVSGFGIYRELWIVLHARSAGTYIFFKALYIITL